LLIRLEDLQLPFHKQHPFQPKQSLLGGNKYLFYLKKSVIIERLFAALVIYSSDSSKMN
ncbi:hypothetical protein AAUPMB_05338, partial [Pasteurella multocida subsp. multocida str. Anand1_buffalo]